MKPSATRIERMLAKLEAALVPPPRKWLRVIIHEGDDDEAEAKERTARYEPQAVQGPELPREAVRVGSGQGWPVPTAPFDTREQKIDSSPVVSNVGKISWENARSVGRSQ